MELRLKTRYKAFTRWQQRPHRVAPMSDEEHTCHTCGTIYKGNYCPRCGQSARIGRYSFKNAFLLFLDVWGLGNRGMFRSLKHLILRPGYMIRDYLSGMQMAYFPPFKMLFLLLTLALVVDSGLNIKGQYKIDHIIQMQEVSDKAFDEGKDTVGEEDELSDEEKLKAKEYADEIKQWTQKISKWMDPNSPSFMVVYLLFVSCVMYFLFRHSPNIPDIRFSEFFVGMVYTNNMRTIYDIIIAFLCLEGFIEILPFALTIVSLKQLSGYSYKSTIWRSVVGYALALLLVGVIAMIAVMVYLAFNTDLLK